jgi:hypothetical protein
MVFKNLMLGLLLCSVLSACYQSADVTLHQPGVYKGQKDPLVRLQASAQQQQKLRERFQLVQTDR